MFSRSTGRSSGVFSGETRKEEKVPITTFLFSCRGVFVMGSFLLWRVFHLSYKVRHLEMLYYKLMKDVQQKNGGDVDNDADISDELNE